MTSLSGRTIAVVGGAGGIGRALVARLRRDGATVIVLDLPASLARHPVEGGAAIPVDLLSEGSVTQAVMQLADVAPALDGVVNLAGFNTGLEPLATLSLADFDVVVGGNLRGAFLIGRAVLPLMAEGASLVMVSSGLSYRARPGYGAYASAKAGLNNLTRVFALEAAPRIRVNAVAPGAIDTAFLRGGTGRSDESGPATIDMEAYARAIPLGRAARVEDVVGPIVFLLGPDSAYMTGQIVWINGGDFMP